jgi:hypothetical protein
MGLLTLMPLVAAVVAGALAWRYAERIDRQTPREHWLREQGSDQVGPFALLAALVAALAATTLVQLTVVSKLIQP